jgi:hypothetical protein
MSFQLLKPLILSIKDLSGFIPFASREFQSFTKAKYLIISFKIGLSLISD